MLYPNLQANSRMQAFQYHMLETKYYGRFWKQTSEKIACESGLSLEPIVTRSEILIIN